MTPIVLTVCTRFNAQTSNYAQTLKAQGWQYELCGLGQPWEGWITKTRVFHAAVKKIMEERGGQQLLFLTDANDVLCQGSPEKALRAWETHYASRGVTFVISSERLCGGNCLPPTRLWEAHGRLSTAYINAGCMAGTAEHILEILGFILERSIADDQVGIAKYIQQTSRIGEIRMDDSHLFYTATHADLNGTTVVDQATGKEMRGPVFIHFPGIRLLIPFADTTYSSLSARLTGPMHINEELTTEQNTMIWAFLATIAALLLVAIATLAWKLHAARRVSKVKGAGQRLRTRGRSDPWNGTG